MKRKIIIAIAVLAVTAAGFYGYLRLTGFAVIRLPEPAGRATLESSQTTAEQPQQIGQTVIHSVGQSRYTILDPVTKKVKRVLGFAKLLNPGGAQSAYWQVEQPYMEVYEDRYRCRIKADRGDIHVEQTGGAISPRDASLSGNVVIRILPQQMQQFAPADIRLDQVSYSCERSEFSTDGSVRLLSSQARLDGKGMLFIYNPDTGRIEYFQIRQLDSLRLKNAVKSSLFSSKTETDKTVAVPSNQTVREPDQPAFGRRKGTYYQCSLSDEVVIRYGRQLIVEGAEQVNIANLLLAGQNRTAAGSADRPAAANAADDSANPGAETAETIWDEPIDITPDDDSADIVVKCRGGVVVEPVGVPEKDNPSALSVNLTGSPLQIFRVEPAAPDKPLPLATCRNLYYLPELDILNLSANKPYPISLYFDGGTNMLQTAGAVLWDRKAGQAQVSGPGKVRFAAETSGKRGAESEMSFPGSMELLFSEPRPGIAGSPLQIKTVNLAGGMNAVLRGKSLLYTRAKSAHFEFADAGRLTQADLAGDVHFQTNTDNPAQAAADTARFKFGGQADLLNAELNGNVHFENGRGTLSSDNATVAFATDRQGNTSPTSITTADKTALRANMGAKNAAPALFQTRRLDYDLTDGAARAAGPVSLAFQILSDPNDPKAKPTPVLITARDDARFVSGSKGVEQVVFNGDVVCDASVEDGDIRCIRKIFGDRLTVNLASDIRGNTRPAHIAVEGKKVLLKEMLLSGDTKLNHVELTCLRLDYFGDGQTITAAGPGKIELNNQQSPPVSGGAEPDALDLRKPCYAIVDGFDRLVWSMPQRTITVDGKTNSLNLSYLPMLGGRPGIPVYAAASKAFLTFAPAVQSRTQLQSLRAEGGVYIEERDRHTLVGQTLDYSARDSLLRIEGSPDRPCLVDGANAPAIEYNLLTGRLKTRLSTVPGAIPIR